MSGRKIVVRDNIYIPVKYIDEDQALDEYTTHLFDEQQCKTCHYRKDRPSDACTSCEFNAYKGSYCTATTSTFKNNTRWLRVPIGDRANFAERLNLNLKKFEIRDFRTKAPLRVKAKFTGQLRDYQQPIVDSWVELGYGLTKSAPRTGKTVMGIAGGLKLGQRILIIADQKDYLDGFLETIVGSDTAPALTNFPKLEEKLGRKLVGFAKDKKDFEELEIALCTIQSLMGKNGEKRLKWANKNFGTFIIDEVHKANADGFIRVVSKLRMKYGFGLTATPKRKDQKQFLVEQFVGPVTASSSVKALTPTIFVHKTPSTVVSKSNYNGPSGFTYCENFLSKHKDRNEMLLDFVMQDLKEGRSIAIGLKRVAHIHEFVKEINKRYGKEIARAFVGGQKAKKERKEIVELARSSKIRVVVGSRKLIQTGINVPRWDTLYYAMPMSNEPNWEQESCRICTPASAEIPKKDPIIRMFVDMEISLALGCFRKTIGFSGNLGHNFSQQSKKTIAMVNAMAGKRQAYADDHLLNDYEYNAPKKKQTANPVRGLGLGGRNR